MDSIPQHSTHLPPPKTQGRRARRAYAKTRARTRVDPALLKKMWHIFAAHYDGVSWEQFLADLRTKSHVILLFDKEHHELCGFSTITASTHSVGNIKHRVVFSGDTILAPSYRGGPSLSRAFVRFMLSQWIRYPRMPLRWLLISKGYKTYLLLARNFLEYYPSFKGPTPTQAQELLDQVCNDRFGRAYRPQLGLVRFEQSQCKLKPHVAPIDPKDLSDPDIAFFIHANPGHEQGDELACLGYFTPWMMLHFLKRSLLPKKSRSSRLHHPHR